jgi:NAD(P)-dependent dehydrogenase (short-subunit alcohol dehydrogenase family)
MLTKCLALDGARDGVRVNCVCPGFTDTPLLQKFFTAQDDPDGARAAAMAMKPLGRLGTADDMAEAYVYLASDHASYVTGVALPVDGGMISGLFSE